MLSLVDEKVLMRFYLILLLVLSVAPLGLRAQGVSLMNGATFGADAGAGAAQGGASLFAGRAQNGLFAQQVRYEPGEREMPMAKLRGNDVQVIRHLIGQAESRRDGYDAVQHGARIKPPKRPTQMSIAEIYQWIAQTPGQPHAIGRYQFIPKTLVHVVQQAGISQRQKFTPAVQDRLADVLLAEAGLQQFRSGAMGRVTFMNNLARIWAGLPNSTGKSHYHGYAGNKASISWAFFDAVMAKIGPRKKGRPADAPS
ncbi:MAG: hypothetical protein ACSHWZ_12525 [Sulfitobacter sp.]